jgi:hypothetical protein
MITTRIANQEELEYVRLNPIEDATKGYPHLDLNGYALSAIVEGKVVGVGGVIPMWDGVGEGWFILTKDVLNCKVEIILVIHKIMKRMFEDLKLWRLQAHTRVDFPKAIELLEHLGFKREGRMSMYLPDKSDAYLYSRVIEEY